MINRELFIGIRFSAKASEKIRDSDIKVLKKKLKQQYVKPVEEALKKYDKKVKIWVTEG